MEALYFPYLSLPTSSWVNPSLLFFDRIDVIAPEGRPADLFDRRTEALLEADLVRPIPPFAYRWNQRDDERFMAYLFGVARSPPRISGFERLHFRKIAHTPLGHELVAAGLLVPVEGDWLEGPKWVCAHVMSYLAEKLAFHPDLQIPLVTDDDAAERLMVGKPPRRSQRSRTTRALSKLLPVPGHATVNDLVRFKEQHTDELTRFRQFVRDLVTRNPLDPDGEARFEGRLGEAVQLRQHLEQEVRAMWGPSGIDISIAATVALAPALEGSYLSAGAGLLGLANAGRGMWKERGRRRRAMRDPVVYSALVSNAWRPATAAIVLR